MMDRKEQLNGMPQLHPVTGHILGAASGFPGAPLTRLCPSGLMHPVPSQEQDGQPSVQGIVKNLS